MKLKKLTLFATALLTFSSIPMANAVSIFSDDFNRPNNNNIVGPTTKWSGEINKDANDVAISSNKLRLRDDKSGTYSAAATTKAISTIGYDNLSLSFKWGSLGSTDDDQHNRDDNHDDEVGKLFLSWSEDKNLWTSLWYTDLGGYSSTLFTETVSNLSALKNLSSIYLRFWTDVDEDDAGAYIDNVVLTGSVLNLPVNAQTTSNVPEPSVIALLSLGVMGWFGFKRKLV